MRGVVNNPDIDVHFRHLPAPLLPVLMHVTSLPSPYGIGDVEPWLLRGWTKPRCRPDGHGSSALRANSIWQLAVLSAVIFCGNALLVSPDLLIEDGLLDPDGVTKAGVSQRARLISTAIIAFKHRCSTLPGRTSRPIRTAMRADFEQFCLSSFTRLEDYALFRALKAHLRGADLFDWPANSRGESFGHRARAPRVG